jgi:predicted phage terminase large subunit-like protein
MPTRFRDPKTSRRVGIMQRLHTEDPAGLAEEEGGWEFLRLPMRYEPKAASYTTIGGDLRTEEGELLWPARFPEEEVRRLEQDMGTRVAAAQLQQRPAPDGGLLFKREWFRSWAAPGVAPPAGTWTALPARFDQLIQSWDCSFKDTASSDYVVGQVWGRRAADFFLLDQIRARMNLPATLEAVRAMTRKWPRVTAILIEDKANGPAVISTLQKELSGLVAVNPEGGKEARAAAVTPLFEAGNVWHPDPAAHAWVDEHREELVIFPRGKHDDSVDACTQALLYLHKRRTALAEAMAAFQARYLKGPQAP